MATLRCYFVSRLENAQNDSLAFLLDSLAPSNRLRRRRDVPLRPPLASSTPLPCTIRLHAGLYSQLATVCKRPHQLFGVIQRIHCLDHRVSSRFDHRLPD